MKTMLAVLAAGVILGALGPPGAAPAQVSQPPPLDIRLRTLPNGLKVYSVPDRTKSEVTVQVWYGVGAKNDPPGRSGFAHLFEHLMFKATRDMPAEYMTRLTDDVGGMNNASTDEDYTQFYSVVPASHLEPLLWAEAERMSALVVDKASLVAERAVVEDELRERVLSDPYGRLLALDVPAASFSVHPYRRSTIGSSEDLEAATLADVRAFHALYYRPDNASLVVVGAFDPDQLNAWVDKYFGPIARPATPVPRVTVREPVRTRAQVFDSYGPEAPLPAVALTFAGPDAASPDAVALDVLDSILTSGKASRLNTRLVDRRRLAADVFSDADLHQQGGVIDVGAVLNPGVKLARGERALRDELADLRNRPVSDAELRSAKDQLLVDLLADRESIDGVASQIGEAAVVDGDAWRVNADVGALEAVTAADVQRVARTYLVDDRRVTIRYHAAGWRATRAAHLIPADRPVLSAPAPTIADADIAQPAPEARQLPPEPAPEMQAALPTPVERTLSNGLRVIVARTGDVPLSTAYLAFRGGSALDPPDQAGLTQLTASLAARGAGGRSAIQLEVAAEALGDSLEAATDYDSSSFSLTGLSATLPQALTLLREVAREPNMEVGELQRLRREVADGLWASMDDPESISSFAVAPLVFGQGPYGHTMTGVPRSLAHIDRADVMRQYERLFRPDNAVLVLTGDVDPDVAFASAERAFGDWPRPGGAPPTLAESGPSPSGRAIAIDIPRSNEATVTVAARSIGRLDPDYYAVEVANAVLGGGYGSRLNSEIRVRRGLTYDAGSEVNELYGAGLFSATAQTRNESAPVVAGLMLDQLKALRASPPSAAELTARKAALIGEFNRHVRTGDEMAALLADEAIYGLDVGELGHYPARVMAVTPDQVQAAAARLADPARTDVLVVGDAKAFLPALKARFDNVEVIEEDALNLTSPDLR